MKRLIVLFLLCVFAVTAQAAIRGQAVTVNTAPSGACASRQIYVVNGEAADDNDGKHYCCVSSTWAECTDTAIASHGNGANCSAGEIALGVDGSGAVEGCYEPAEADISDLDHIATSITDNLIVEADLKAVDAAADEECLTYESTVGDFEWQSCAAAAHGNGANCSAGEIALGVDADGAVEGCYEPTEADISDLDHIATSITDDLILEADLDVDESPADNDILTFDTTGSNFSWQTPAELSLQPLDTELTLISGLAETTGNIMISVGGAWASVAQPVLDCTNCTNTPAGSPAGSDSEVQYNNSSSFGAEATFTYNDSTNVLTASGGFTTGATATPSLLFLDSTTSGEAKIAVSDAAGPDGIMDFQVDVAGTLTTYFKLDGSTGTVETLTGLDAIGAVDMDYGSADVTDHTFTTDGTGTAEVVMPAGSVDSTELLDATIQEVDLKVVDSPADEECLTYESTTGDFEWQSCGGGTVSDTKCAYIEDPTAADDLQSLFANKTSSAWTLTELWAESDQTVTFMLQVDDGTPADIDSVDLAPAAGEAEDTSLNGDTELAAGEELDLVIASVASTPTWVSICITFTK